MEALAIAIVLLGSLVLSMFLARAAILRIFQAVGIVSHDPAQNGR